MRVHPHTTVQVHSTQTPVQYSTPMPRTVDAHKYRWCSIAHDENCSILCFRILGGGWAARLSAPASACVVNHGRGYFFRTQRGPALRPYPPLPWTFDAQLSIPSTPRDTAPVARLITSKTLRVCSNPRLYECLDRGSPADGHTASNYTQRHFL